VYFKTKLVLFSFVLFLLPTASGAQSAPAVHPLGPDERYKADILLIIAHPDDEGIASPYLARAIDEGKRVAVAYGTRGGNGSNTAGMEHAAALADIREIEARRALATIGITNVWFLGGKDTASQNVLQSLASWGHGSALEEAVRIVRLTRPEVIITLLPGVFIGENHGDHQAAGVIATEAFELSGDPTVFPAQVTGASRRLEPFLENLRSWQPKKLYYAMGGGDDAKGKGPEYSITGISKSRNLPFWRLAVQSFMAHETQAKAYIDSVAKMDEAQLQKMGAENRWTNPRRFILGKSLVGGSMTGDIFEGISPGAIEPPARRADIEKPTEKTPDAGFTFQLAGPWGFYDRFRRAYGLEHIPQASPPEIAVQEKTTFYVPLYIRNNLGTQQEVAFSLEMPADWKLKGDSKYLLRAKEDAQIHLDIDLPAIAATDATAREQHDITVRAEAAGKTVGELKLRVQLRKRALPQ